MIVILRKHKTPGRCPVARCKNKPRNAGTRPNSVQLCGSHHKQQWRRNNPLKAAFDNLRNSAYKRRKAFSLTFEDFFAVIAPTRYMDERGRTRYCLHIDRIKDDLGYIRGNIRVITCTENVTKENERRKREFVDAKINRRNR